MEDTQEDSVITIIKKLTDKLVVQENGFRAYTNSKGLDQPAQVCLLIKIFAFVHWTLLYPIFPQTKSKVLIRLCRIHFVHDNSTLRMLGKNFSRRYYENVVCWLLFLFFAKTIGSQTTVLHMKRLNQTESPIFMILCVLCFKGNLFGLYLSFHVILKYSEIGFLWKIQDSTLKM